MLKFRFSDGVISRSEMLAYFIRGNSRLLRSSFKHNFHETTYFRPTYCAHCNGLVSFTFVYK